MISIRVNQSDIKKLDATINKKIKGIEEVSNSRSLTEFAKATFTITGKKFVRDINNAAKFDSSLKHMYEWNSPGINTQRLFLINRAKVLNGNLVITTTFLKSKKPVPIKKELLKPGQNGKTVTAKNIFRNKAEVMEEGRPVNVISKKYLVFPGKQGKLVFLSRGKSVKIKNPGGKTAKNAYTKFMLAWYRKNGSLVMEESPIFKQIEKSVAKALNSQGGSVSQAREAVRLICSKYSEGKVTL